MKLAVSNVVALKLCLKYSSFIEELFINILHIQIPKLTVSKTMFQRSFALLFIHSVNLAGFFLLTIKAKLLASFSCMQHFVANNRDYAFSD
jgi:hypothetical protein